MKILLLFCTIIVVGLVPCSEAQLGCALPNAAICLGCTIIAPCVNARPDSYIPCAAIDSTKPFCETTSHGAVCKAITNGCSVPVSSPSIICSGEGNYPDPSDCSKYHTCSTAGSDSNMVQCPGELMYDSIKNVCAYKPAPDNCDFRCNTLRTMFVVYKPDPRYYIYCRPDSNGDFTTSRARVIRCPESFIYKNVACVFECAKEGNFVDPTNPRKYFQCILLPDGSFYRNVVECPVGMTVVNGICSQ